MSTGRGDKLSVFPGFPVGLLWAVGSRWRLSGFRHMRRLVFDPPGVKQKSTALRYLFGRLTGGMKATHPMRPSAVRRGGVIRGMTSSEPFSLAASRRDSREGRRDVPAGSPSRKRWPCRRERGYPRLFPAGGRGSGPGGGRVTPRGPPCQRFGEGGFQRRLLRDCGFGGDVFSMISISVQAGYPEGDTAPESRP